MSPSPDRDEPAEPLQRRIVSTLTTKGSRILSMTDLAKALDRGSGANSENSIPPPGRDELEAAVAALESAGRIVRLRGKKYSLIEFTPFYSGRLRAHPDGYAFLLSRDPEVQDLRIPKRSLKGAMDGDLVLARIEKEAGRGRFRSRAEGAVVEILERKHSQVVGRFESGGRQAVVVPFDQRLDSEILIAGGAEGGAKPGDMVHVRLTSYPGENTPAVGEIIEVLGKLGDPGVDIEIVIRKYQLRHEFSDTVEREAERVPLFVGAADLAGREDFRGTVIVTIDGETAKDFDDAVSVTLTPAGHYVLGVHIADVSHYVREDGAIDLEARERGTSVYFPGRAIPMLPERLSNDICSLKPRQDRLTLSAILEFDAGGALRSKRFSRSVIHSSERLTYTEVRRILEDALPADRERYGQVWKELHHMRDLAAKLGERRHSRGSIDFDLPEADVRLSERGEITGIYASERNVAHRIIEEFMLAANEAVAHQLFWAEMPAIYRVHDLPDPLRLLDLKELLAEFGYQLKGNPEELHAKQLQTLLVQIQGEPEERFLSQLILRAMKRAVYSAECRGHFALAAKYYLHFTSPIRRYPDLVVHRRLVALLAGGTTTVERETLARRFPGIAAANSDSERRAEEAEREVLEWKKIIFMRDKIGNEYAGRITGVVNFGLFVELEDFFVEGLVPAALLGNEFFHFDDRGHRMKGERTSKEYRLGDRLRVRVESVDETRRQVNFGLAGVARRAVPEGRKRRP